MRTQLDNKTRHFHAPLVPQDYAAKNSLAKLYDHLLRDTLILHPDFPALVTVTEMPMQPLESLLGFYLIEIEIKHTVDVNDALSPNFRTLLAIWQNPNALKTPMTVAGMATQHIDWTNPLSWTGVFSTLASATPPSIKAFVNKSEYQGLVFSQELCRLLTPEIKFKPDIERIKRMTALLQQSTEKLHVALLREHGLSERAPSGDKKEHSKEKPKEEKEKEADLTLTFAESVISDLSAQNRVAFMPAATQLTKALDNYLKIASQQISLGVLARKISRWYDSVLIPTVEHLFQTSVASPTQATAMSSASSGSTTASVTTNSSLSQSLNQTLIGASQKSSLEPSGTAATTSSSIAIKSKGV